MMDNGCTIPGHSADCMSSLCAMRVEEVFSLFFGRHHNQVIQLSWVDAAGRLPESCSKI